MEFISERTEGKYEIRMARIARMLVAKALVQRIDQCRCWNPQTILVLSIEPNVGVVSVPDERLNF